MDHDGKGLDNLVLLSETGEVFLRRRIFPLSALLHLLHVNLPALGVDVQRGLKQQAPRHEIIDPGLEFQAEQQVAVRCVTLIAPPQCIPHDTRLFTLFPALCP